MGRFQPSYSRAATTTKARPIQIISAAVRDWRNWVSLFWRLIPWDRANVLLILTLGHAYPAPGCGCRAHHPRQTDVAVRRYRHALSALGCDPQSGLPYVAPDGGREACRSDRPFRRWNSDDAAGLCRQPARPRWHCAWAKSRMWRLPFIPPGSTDDAEQDFVYSGSASDRWDLFLSVRAKAHVDLAQ